MAHRLGECAVTKLELPRRARLKRADVLLHVGVLVVVDAHEPMASCTCEALHHRGLASGGGPLEQDGEAARRHHARDGLETRLDRWRHYVARIVHGPTARVSLDPKASKLDPMLPIGRLRRCTHGRRLRQSARALGQQMAEEEGLADRLVPLLQLGHKGHVEAVPEGPLKAVRAESVSDVGQGAAERAQRELRPLVGAIEQRRLRLGHRRLVKGDDGGDWRVRQDRLEQAEDDELQILV